ncbi:A/G-specific DNA-adenine glycosylase [Sphingomonas guangdongensis]|uniref:Adenine DNA glycosylase n=1 Tax=Sphingomonas guangdongensis TaxID=1141890 RepID=A0A285QG92_9SPHN|nr:A/G-specific adenine glycosylase [Sphingomonas guangdongensis]SOB80960.1 A/G-specific DNA-adenine glycosylase [Sphingomonas guangdongensis]
MSAKPFDIPLIAPRLLAWYDAHARALPWRAPPGANRTDPYRVWLSEVMLQQTTVATVRPRFEAWVARWDSVAALAAADEAEVMAAWAGLGYYARARNLHACARAIIAEHDGRFPEEEAALRRLPGLGDYTAAAIAAIAFGKRAVVIDSNIKRVAARLAARPTGEVRDVVDAITPDARAGDFAQALMDLANALCTVRAPKCLACPLRENCAGFATGDPAAFPARKPKKERPVRHGTLFWLRRGDDVLLVRRPTKGLLGGMRALPTGPWSEAPPDLSDAPAVADWRMLDEGVSHGFTHFQLDLSLACATYRGQEAPDGEWWPVADLARAGLPTVFAKAAAVFGRVECA